MGFAISQSLTGIDRWPEMILMMTCHLKIYHLGHKALVGDNRAHLTLTAAHEVTWLEFTQKAAREALKKMKMRIPGGNMPNK